MVCPQCGNLASVTETPQIQRLRRRIGSLCDPQPQWWCLGVKDLPTLQGVEGWASTLMLTLPMERLHFRSGQSCCMICATRARFCFVILACFSFLVLLAGFSCVYLPGCVESSWLQEQLFYLLSWLICPETVCTLLRLLRLKLYDGCKRNCPGGSKSPLPKVSLI